MMKRPWAVFFLSLLLYFKFRFKIYAFVPKRLYLKYLFCPFIGKIVFVFCERYIPIFIIYYFIYCCTLCLNFFIATRYAAIFSFINNQHIDIILHAILLCTFIYMHNGHLKKCQKILNLYV